MILQISQKLGLASFNGRYFGAERAQRLAGIEVTEFLEYKNPELCSDARELLSSGYAETRTVNL